MNYALSQNFSLKSLPTGEVIIQCPSCQTKFALEPDTLQGLEDPRFHCSRCDYIFKPEDSLSAEETVQAKVQPKYFVDDLDPPSFRENTSRSIAACPCGAWALQIPSRIEERWRSSAPHEMPDEDPPVSGQTSSQMEFDFTKKPENRPLLRSGFSISSLDDDFRAKVGAADSRTIRDCGCAEKEDPALSSPYPTQEPVDTSARFREPQAFTADPPVMQMHTPKDLSEQQQSMNTYSEISGAARWRSFVVFMLPILIVLTLLTAGSYYLRTSGTAAGWLARTFFHSAPRIAPPGLYIRNARLRNIVLDNGDKVLVISGKIVNQSQERFSEVMVEAIGFNELGEPTVKTKVNAASTLAKTRIKSLTPEMIRSLQSTEAEKGFLLKPGGQQDFAVALGDGPLVDEDGKVRYFSARIYSVRQK